jgi:hypothetical protein
MNKLHGSGMTEATLSLSLASCDGLQHDIRVGPRAMYAVNSGDSLSKIATSYFGNANEYKKIAKANNIADPDIQAGQQLRFLEPRPEASTKSASAGNRFNPLSFCHCSCSELTIDKASPCPDLGFGRVFFMARNISLSALFSSMSFSSASDQ